MKKLIKTNRKLNFSVLIIIVITLSFSCEDDFTTVGGEFINSLELPDPYVVENLTAYSDKVLSVQTNGLNNFLLGNFSDEVFGNSEVSILSQLELERTSPDFGMEPELDSVILTLPLFSRIIGFNEERNKDIYRLDSVYGGGSFRIKVYKSNYFLRNIDPGSDGSFNQGQIYYSDQYSEIQDNIEPIPIFESEVITPSDLTLTQVLYDQLDTITIDTLRVSPRIRLSLPNNTFQENIIDQLGSNNLVSQNSFKNFFRGLYIVAESTSDEGAMVKLNLNSNTPNSDTDADITLYYRSLRPPPSLEIVEDPEPILTYNKFRLNFSGINLNFYEDTNGIDLSNQDLEQGEENIYIKGGQAIVSIIEPFSGPDEDNNGVPDELDNLRAKNWLVNEANLLLYINEDIAGNLRQPFRIFAYDLDRERVLIDFNLDPSGSENPFTSRTNHLVPLNSEGLFYKIRLTSHINNIINNDSTNTRIGIVMTENVNQARILQVRESEINEVESLIESSISIPRGTALHGVITDPEDENYDRRLKLQIFYTDPNSQN